MLLVLKDPLMINLIKEEKNKGRFPKEIEILQVKLPKRLANGIDEVEKDPLGTL